MGKIKLSTNEEIEYNDRMFGLDSGELRILRRLSTPQKVQDFLNSLPFNFEKEGETYNSPRVVLREGRAHCFEGALLAAAAFWVNGEKPFILDLKTSGLPDSDHVVALYRKFGCWGAVSKTNHAVLRYREPVYRSVRELTMSYFHEYFLNNGQKTLRSFSKPMDLRKFLKRGWLTSEEKLDYLVEALDASPHSEILTPVMVRNLRKADKVEIKAGKIIEWDK